MISDFGIAISEIEIYKIERNKREKTKIGHPIFEIIKILLVVR